MKNKKFPKWLRKLPVLLTALILLVSPLMMAAPADASVLDGYNLPSVDGYRYICSFEIPNSDLFAHYYLPLAFYQTYTDYVFMPSSDISVYQVGRGSFISYRSDNIYLSAVFNANVNLSVFTYYNSFDPNNMIVCLDIGTQVDLSTPLAYYPLPGSYVINYLGEARSDDPPSTYYVFDSFQFVPSSGVLGVFTGVGYWLSGAVQNISTMFWTSDSGMTVLGYLAVASLALAVILLIFYLIAGWLKFH